MDNEIKRPVMDKPEFVRPPYDYRNIEDAGEFCGVGERGKVGKDTSSSLDAMPASPHKMFVPRDHQG
jgi:hypothetical protein